MRHLTIGIITYLAAVATVGNWSFFGLLRPVWLELVFVMLIACQSGGATRIWVLLLAFLMELLTSPLPGSSLLFTAVTLVFLPDPLGEGAAGEGVPLAWGCLTGWMGLRLLQGVVLGIGVDFRALEAALVSGMALALLSLIRMQLTVWREGELLAAVTGER
jgi:hypothetical protein